MERDHFKTPTNISQFETGPNFSELKCQGEFTKNDLTDLDANGLQPSTDCNRRELEDEICI